MNIQKKNEKSSGYNWRDTLVHYARMSSVLAGFCVTFIALILGGRIAGSVIINEVTFGQLAVLIFGVSAGLFISSGELFLTSKDFDVYSIPDSYIDFLKKDCEKKKIDWNTFVKQQLEQCRIKERMGRKCYNSAILLVFIGLFPTIVPYNIFIAIVVSGFGITLELWQILK